MERFSRLVLAVQGWVYVVGGLWPLVSLSSFEWVTGPKVDDWLVRTVALLTLVIGVTLLLALRRRRVTPELALLAGGIALSFAAIDVIYAAIGRIAPIYLADAALEIVFVIAALGWVRTGRGARP